MKYEHTASGNQSILVVCGHAFYLKDGKVVGVLPSDNPNAPEVTYDGVSSHKP